MMYWRDHNPPHFHAQYGEDEAMFSFDGNVIDGKLPKRATSLVKEWITLHKPELEENWHRARAGEPLQPIEPLE